MLTTSDRHLTTAYWTRDESIELLDTTAARRLAEKAAADPDRIALVGPDHTGAITSLSYRDLHRRSRAIARELMARSRHGEHVAIYAPNVVEWPLIEYAASLTGRVVVALNPQAGIDELRYTLEFSRAVLVLYARDHRGRDLGAMVSEVVPGCPEVRETHPLDTVSEWAAVDSGDDADTGAAERPDDTGWPVVDPYAAAMLQFTSGTTGRQKGVLLTHRAMVNVARITMRASGVTDGETLLSPFPQFHTAGCVTSTLGALAVGGTLVIIDRWDSTEALRIIREREVSTALLVPAMLQGLVAKAEDEAAAAGRPDRIPTILVGAASVPAWVIERAQRLFGGAVLNVYGQTEVCAPLIATRRDDRVHDITTTIGRPLPQVECRIADRATGETVGVDVAGEICARGYQQMLGYYRDPEATAAAVDADGWLHTGDLGSMDSRGMITITGRLKELIIRGGENISPNEVADCLLEHPDVDQVTVVGLPDDRLGEIVAAIVVPSTGSGTASDAAAVRDDLVERLRQHCAERLAQYKIPQRWYVTDTLPTTASGKIRSLAARQLILDGTLR